MKSSSTKSNQYRLFEPVHQSIVQTGTSIELVHRTSSSSPIVKLEPVHHHRRSSSSIVLALWSIQPRGIHQEMQSQSQSLDRISALPQDRIEQILTLMPIRDALRTSILSKKWRYCWTGIPKLVLDDELVNISSDNEEIIKYKLVTAIFHVLLLHKGLISELCICIINTEMENEIDQIILHLSWSKNIKKFILGVVSTHDYYKLPCSFFSLRGLEHLELIYCDFELPLMFNGFSMLKSLVFYHVEISANTLQRFLTSCPLLEEFSLIRNELIELTEGEFVELFKCLPSIQVLEISQFYIEHLDAGDMPHKLPISLPHLRILVLDVCFLELSSVLCVISSSPNLEKIKVDVCRIHDQWCRFQQTDNNLPDIQDYTGLNLNLFKEMEITNFRDSFLDGVCEAHHGQVTCAKESTNRAQ